MSTQEIKVTDPRILNLLLAFAGLIILAGLAAYTIYMSWTTNYIGVYPLDRPQAIVTPMKTRTIVAIYDLKSTVKEPSQIIISDGVLTSVTLGNSSTAYAMVLSRGIDIYVLLVSIAVVLIYIYIVKHSLPLVNLRTRPLLNIMYIVILLIVLVSLNIYIQYNTLNSTATNDSIFSPVQVKLENPVKLPVGNSSFLLYPITDIRSKSLVYIRSNKIYLQVGLLSYKDNRPKLDPLSTLGLEYTGYIDKPEDADKAYLVMVFLATNNTSSINATVEYMKIGFIEVEKGNIYMMSLPALILIVVLAFSSKVAEILSKKPRSSPEEYVQDKHISEEATSRSSSEAGQHADIESHTPSQPQRELDESPGEHG